MTKEEMRELDAWIAEHLFDCYWSNDGGDSSFTWLHTKEDGEQSYIARKLRGEFDYFSDSLPKYSSSQAALFVLEKCGPANLFCVHFTPPSISLLDKQKGHWNVGLLEIDGRWHSDKKATATTLPLAICLFAKKLFSQQ